MKIKIIQIITGLSNGGSERNLYNLCVSINKDKFEVIVVSLTGMGEYGNMLAQIGIKPYCVNLGHGVKLLRIFKLYKFIRQHKPDIIQTWLYHADLIGLVLGRLAGVKKIIWNIRSTQLNFKDTSWHVVIVRKICALLSFMPAKIINCSMKSIEEHVMVGYRRKKFVYVPNGYNLQSLHADKALSLFPVNDYPVIGFVGRDDPQKDIFNFLNALLIVEKHLIDFRVIIVGTITNNERVKQFIRQHNMREVILLAPRADMLNVYNSFDLLVLSSLSEAFPNVVAEAMACGVCCVVTDVGDAAVIVGDTGVVVPPANSTLLADGIISMIESGKKTLIAKGVFARQRIEENFSLDNMINSYEDIYHNVLE
jgi:glycosyltransferase involved in cell wall biosynthesis